MIEEYENLLNCREHLKKNIERIKEAFIKFYGEERREEIEEKFAKAIFVAYRSPDSTSRYLKRIGEIYSHKIEDREYEKVDTTLSKRDIFGYYDMSSKELMPLKKYYDFLKLYEMGPEGRVEKFKKESFESAKKYLPDFTMEEYEEMIKTQTIPKKYDYIRPWLRDNLKYYIDLNNAENSYERAFNNIKELLEKIHPDITRDNFSYFSDHKDIIALTSLAEQLPEMLSEYEARMRKYDSYRREDEYNKELKESLQNKYFLKFIDENRDLLREEDLESVEVFRRDSTKKYNLTSYTNYIFGYSLSSNHPLEAFTEESDKALEREDESDWKKESIKEERIKYFKRNGIDLGNDYSLYIQNEEVKRIWPSKERVVRFIESRDRLQNEFNNEYYTNTQAHKEVREEIDSHHLLDKEDSFNAALYTRSSGTFVNPNIVKKNKKYDLLSLVAVCCDNNSGEIDHNIVHELNHLFELCLKKVRGNHYEVICGWDDIDGYINQDERKPVDTLKEDKRKRSYELFNEIINEIIAQEICEILTKEHFHIFDTEENARTKHTTSYEDTFFLVKDFYQEFKKEIIESRTNGNIEIIWNRVGKENFDALNELFHIYNEHFAGFKKYTLIDSLKKNEDTKQTRLYYELLEKRDKILDKMRKYSMVSELEEEKKKKSKKKKDFTTTKK